jgi:hypothetical protein
MSEEKIHHDLLAEIKKLNIRLDHADKPRKSSPGRYRWLKVFFKDLETNPKTQAKIHVWAVCYWLINFPIILGLFFFAPGIWVSLGLLVNTVYSLYANLATDYGALSAAQATSAIIARDQVAEVDTAP